MTRKLRILLSFALAAGLVAACTPETAPPAVPPSAGGSGGGTTTPQAGASPGGSSGATAGGATTTGGMGGATASAGSSGAPAGGTGGAVGGSGGIPPFTGKLDGIAYSPYRDGQAPGGAQPTLEQVREDLEILQPLVNSIRIYGTDGANAYVPDLCDEMGIDLHVGAWIDGLPSDEPNVLALAALVNENHPSIKTAVVGNEVLNRTEDNGLVEEDLLAFVQIARENITADVPIAVAETYPRWMEMRPNLAAAVDVIIWHTYGWWSGANIEDAYALINSRWQDMITQYGDKPLILGETGWPSMYDNMSDDLLSTAVGSEANQARYYREILGGFRAQNLPTWMFSSFDEQWKGTSGEGMVGAHWGIFRTDRTPKAAATELLMGVP